MKHQPIDYDPHEGDPDQATVDAFYDQVSDVLFWIFVGALVGVVVTVAAFYVWSFYL